MYDSALGDPELVDKIYKEEVEKQSSKRRVVETNDGDHHPPRRGYTREAELLQDLNDNMLAFRAESGHWKTSSVKFTTRPLFPAEAAQMRLRARAQSRRDAGIAAAQARWVREHGDRS